MILNVNTDYYGMYNQNVRCKFYMHLIRNASKSWAYQHRKPQTNEQNPNSEIPHQ